MRHLTTFVIDLPNKRATMTIRAVGMIAFVASAFVAHTETLIGQQPTQHLLITPLLHAGPLSDSLARMVRKELGISERSAVVVEDISGSLQRTDSVGKAWTFESLRSFASARNADAVLDISATRIGDVVNYAVVLTKAPFTIVDSYTGTSQSNMDDIARYVAKQLGRQGFPAKER
jgi:hypothetical protein